ncbi:uncharacterized protein LOC107042619 [Diachasma alloeum]|uniref:uncharacterized protein LOC107042619 n=1 Tax=Diachasma alloeum TaxID=454923 RepID=UPI00073837F6|nr:uncharacterized protein LOC107042619 [Diachasma alloeum]XP_015119223.1 uncharacterized protein LOC107042619 [Diachasma alloeum]XP_015119224.1 uncharacterized protein LOC107042619 [Diachasma alloeum]XP_015119225.1 uncharacterized protein LOC107042619 [Diachasma alloeum]
MSETWNAVVKAHGEEEEEEEEDEEEESKSNEECDKDQALTSITYSSTFLNDDIIDISRLDLEDEETWLLQSNKSELSCCDLRSWLRRDFHEGCTKPNNNITNDNTELGLSIDTRTFTRCKKKMAKLNFDCIKETTLPGVIYNDSESSLKKMKINWKEEETRNEDSIPAMLRQSLTGIILPSSVNAQESLEAFLDMSQSKCIDSFINMAEPEFNDSLMNISRPSFLQTTMSNHSMHSICGMTNIEMADSQILTDSMMQTSMFNEMDGDIVNVNLSQTIDKNWLDSSAAATVLKDISANDGDKTFTPIDFQREISNIDNQHQHLCSINKTFNRLPSSDSSNLSRTITDSEKSWTCLNTIEQAKNFNKTFSSNSSFSKISLNSTFKTPGYDDEIKNNIIEQEDEMSSNTTYVAATANDEVTFPFTQYTEEPTTIAQNNEPTSLDVTYSKRDVIMLNESINNIIKLSPSTEDEIYQGQNDGMPVNRYQTYRKSTAINKIDSVNKLANPIGKIPLNYDENYRGKSMEILDKLSSKTLDSQQIYTKLNGPKSLSRLPQTLQKSNPNLRSHNSTFAKGKTTTTTTTTKITRQSKFGFQSIGRGIMKNGQPIVSNRLTNLAKVQGAEFDKTHTRNSNESIESTLSTYSGPDFDDGLSTCSDGSHHLNCEKSTNSAEQLYKIVGMQEEKLSQESTPKADRKILDNTWIASGTDLPSPILKNNEILDNQVTCSDNLDTVIQTSSPLISPGESLQTFPQNQANHIADDEKIMKMDKSLPLNKLSSVFKPAPNHENKTDGVRLPVSRSSNLPSGIPRPASRIPAPRFSRTNAQVKSQNNIKKGLF